jgi:DNA-binding transcriptional ArsR family regulator
LRDAGLVNIREEGKQTFYSLNQENIVICCGQLMIKFAPETATTEKLVKVISYLNFAQTSGRMHAPDEGLPKQT